MGKSVVLIEPAKHLGGLTVRRAGLHRHREQGGHRRPRPRVLPARQEALRRPAAWKYGKREDVQAATARPRTPCGPSSRTSPSRSSTRCSARPRSRSSRASGSTWQDGVEEGRHAHRCRMHDGDRRDVSRQDVHRRHLRRRPDGRRPASATPSAARRTRSTARRSTASRGEEPAQPPVRRKVDPYVKPGDPASGLLLGIDAGPAPADGEGDHRVQAYNFRMCLTDVPENRVPFPKPADYDESEVRAAPPQLRGRRPALPDEARH